MMKEYVYSWLKKQELVVVGYCSTTKGVNFFALIAFWLDCGRSMSELENFYPYVAQDLQIKVSSANDSQMLADILKDFDGCRHLKAWSYGDEIDLNFKNTQD